MAEGELSKETLKKISAFLSNKKVLVADSTSACRSSISRTLVELGGKTPNLLSVQDYLQCLETLKQHQVEIIITDYNLTQNTGLNLIAEHKQMFPDMPDRMTILATANSSESAVAEAADEDVDAYIMKPYSGASVKMALSMAFADRIDPSDFKKMTLKSQDEFNKKNFEEALKAAHAAKKLGSKPSLAYFYAGQIYEAMGKTHEAITEYREGLKSNELHYKCLVGLFELLMKVPELRDDAYKIARKLVENFPLSPKRLGNVFELAVFTHNFTDVNGFYELFTKLELRPPELIRRVAAGFIVCGMYLLKQGKPQETADAHEAFKKAINASVRNSRIVKEVALACLHYEQTEKAEEYLKSFTDEDRESADFKITEFLITSYLTEPGQWVMRGKKLVSEGIKDVEVFETLIQGFVEIQKTDIAKEVLAEAIKAFPDQKANFEELLN